MNLNSDKLPESKKPYIRERLENIDDNRFHVVNATEFKSPDTMLILSIFLGGWGVDRFMLGETGLGVAKLLTCGGMGIWTIVDWFSVKERTRSYNVAKLNSVL